MACEPQEISLSEAALHLGISWNQAWRLVLKKRIAGRKAEGRWFVSLESVVRERERRDSTEQSEQRR